MRAPTSIAALLVAILLAGSAALVHWWTAEPPPADPAPAAGARGLPPLVDVAGPALAATPPAPASAPAGMPPPLEQAAAGATSPPRTDASPRTATPGAIRVSFRLDPRLTKGLHMGDRWISPATYVGAQSGGVFTVDAKALGLADGGGGDGPAWVAAEPDMVAVSPDRGARVLITVLRPGESTLTVREGDRVAPLVVKAVQRDGVWRVDISQ